MKCEVEGCDEIAKYVIERDKMLRSLDVNKFNKFYKKHKLPMPEGGWADAILVPLLMMHKARLQINSMSKEEKQLSKDWLLSRGYRLPPGVA